MNIPNKFNKIKINKQDSGLRKIYVKHYDRGGKTLRFLDSINRDRLFYINSYGMTDAEWNAIEYYEIVNGQDLIFYMTWTGDLILYTYNFNIYVNEMLYKSYEVRLDPSQVELYIDLPLIKENLNYYFELIEIEI